MLCALSALCSSGISLIFAHKIMIRYSSFLQFCFLRLGSFTPWNTPRLDGIVHASCRVQSEMSITTYFLNIEQLWFNRDRCSERLSYFLFSLLFMRFEMSEHCSGDTVSSMANVHVKCEWRNQGNYASFRAIALLHLIWRIVVVSLALVVFYHMIRIENIFDSHFTIIFRITPQSIDRNQCSANFAAAIEAFFWHWNDLRSCSLSSVNIFTVLPQLIFILYHSVVKKTSAQ